MATFTSQASQPRKTVMVEFEGTRVQVPEGLTVAVALLGHAGADHCCLNSADASRRAPYCLMGVCFECLVEIDGIPNRQACLTRVADGMNIRRQRGITEWSV